MLLMSGVSTSHAGNLKRDSLVTFQAQRLRPKPFSELMFNPLSNESLAAAAASSSKAFTTVALFKSKTKAPPKKVSFFAFLVFVNGLFWCLVVSVWLCTGCSEAKSWRWYLWNLWGNWLYKAKWALCWSCCHDWLCCEYYSKQPNHSNFCFVLVSNFALKVKKFM